MSVSITPVSASLGAEIVGVDLNRRLDAETVAAIHAAWLEHIVLIFRGQDLSEQNQRRFAACLTSTLGSPALGVATLLFADSSGTSVNTGQNRNRRWPTTAGIK